MSGVKHTSLHTSQVAHQAEAYLGFCGMTRLGVFPLPPPALSYPVPILHTWVETGTVRVTLERVKNDRKLEASCDLITWQGSEKKQIYDACIREAWPL